MRARSKYGNVRTVVDGHTFASKREARRYVELKLLQHHAKIGGLTLQPKFVCAVQHVPVCTYIADFAYFDYEKNANVVEDVKGFKTAIYRLKKKLVLACFGIEIQEVA